MSRLDQLEKLSMVMGKNWKDILKKVLLKKKRPYTSPAIKAKAPMIPFEEKRVKGIREGRNPRGHMKSFLGVKSKTVFFCLLQYPS